MKKRKQKAQESVADLLKYPSLSVMDAARVLRVGRRRINTLIESKALKTYPEGARLRVVTASIDQYINRMTEGDHA